MNDLVVLQNDKPVTSSLQIARTFNNNHRDVLEVIDKKIDSAENSAQYKSMFLRDRLLGQCWNPTVDDLSATDWEITE